MRTIEEIRHARLLQLIAEPRFKTIQALADAIERSHSQVSQWKNRNERKADPTLGQYFDSILSASITIGGYTATGLGGYIVVSNDWMGGGDRYSFVIDNSSPGAHSYGHVSGPDVGSRFPYLIAMTLFDGTATAFNSDAFPTTLNLADFADRRAELGFALQVIPGVAFGATSAVTSVDSLVMSTVAEPASWGLLAAGGLLIGLRRRRRV